MKLSSIYSDGMILQRGKDICIRGTCGSDEKIIVSFSGNTYDALVDTEKALWTCMIPAQKEGGPHQITVTSGPQSQMISDIYFGDVFILGGQSNMELPVIWTTDCAYDEIISADFPLIRQFEVPKIPKFGTKDEALEGGSWVNCDQKHIWNFSAIGFYFAKYKFLKDGVPVGLVQTAVGGAPVESLMSEENLRASMGSFEDELKDSGTCNGDKSKGCLWCYKEKLEKYSDPEYVRKIMESDMERQNSWHQNVDKNDPGLSGNWMTSWPEEGKDLVFTMPQTFYQTDLETYKGSIWIQKKVSVPASWCEKRVELRLGTLIDGDQTYVNGKKVGETGFKYPPRRYFMEPGTLVAGENTITVRLVIDTNIGGAVEKCPYFLKNGEETISLEGEWKMRLGFKAEDLEGQTFFIWSPTALFNSMLYPIREYSCKAIFFYQGESNCEYPQYYGQLLKDMVKEWRTLYGNVPFYMAEVTYWLGDGPVYEADPFDAVRDVQRSVISEIPDGYLIPTYDLGAYNDLHPQNKKDVGLRFLKAFEENT